MYVSIQLISFRAKYWLWSPPQILFTARGSVQQEGARASLEKNWEFPPRIAECKLCVGFFYV
jgi:hypothetical protein